MNFLIDTHVLIWFITDHTNLPKQIKVNIENTDNTCLCSFASIWEIAIKHSIGKLELNFSVNELIKITEDSLIELLPIKLEHITKSTALPLHHRNPFDRLLIAQAQSENLTLISKDAAFAAYDLQTMWI